ncbi:hypothetical protein [Roseimaritima ulvae]|uniref:Fimbrial assembly protein (PilN) n=1 Tax=Roseimaritima ulvae TaxID=980254 RepID=A0A5B9QZV9_9BACT|nr:hypothetical protein [Roseimaritima ulvae]QEG43539.1 hypothetical protein UC8_55900 [Roseimaritima ulvae]
MPTSNATNYHPTCSATESAAAPQQRVFGLRIAENLLQLAVATPDSSGIFDLQIDEIAAESPGGWFSSDGAQDLQQALALLAARWEMRRKPLAVSLDGNFCVTRIAMGQPDRVDEDVRTVNNRVQRYLSLGPGEKIVGRSREQLAPGVDYAVTAVVNRDLIQEVYEALRGANLNITWVEPSLVSIARLLGRSGRGDEPPILIADCSGGQWDIGIAHQGRLLLDYRPAAARSADGLREALLGHVERLRRFCDRHRAVAAGDLTDLLLCGSASSVREALQAFANQSTINAKVMDVPPAPDLYHLDTDDMQVDRTAAVAAVLPLLDQTEQASIPDLLTGVRRESELSRTSQCLRLLAPLVLAAAILLPLWTLTSRERERLETIDSMTYDIEDQLTEAQTRLRSLVAQRTLVNHLQQIEATTGERDWDELFMQVARCLPPEAKLNELRWQSSDELVLDGTLHDETMIFDIIGYLRRLPDIREVALQGTSSSGGPGQTRFEIRLSTRPTRPSQPADENPYA